ncbi:MAG: 2-oxoacid:acceptor oxidoreductase family protein [Bifidobacteriaceae bacterium]|jgi:pyruvate-ferredoxin/flavodoxin oxidoreductase|nr:2-oxoacid:acceptor oxidoreductase family protein [Bifidobacteriaceae bacterium]
MKHVCGGMIGYPITPSTEISETFEAARAEGQLNVWGAHPFFVEAEGEHSGQSGALGAALTGGNYISNASSSQGILYGLESHYVTAGKKVGGFVLQVAARVVSKHSLNVMAGHDDIYALLPSGYTVFFGSSPQEAADLAAVSYRTAALSLIPVANAMDGFATSHVMTETLLPEPTLLRDYLGDPKSRVACPTVAQEILFGAKGRRFQLDRYLERRQIDFDPGDLAALRAHLDSMGDAVERDNDAQLAQETLVWVPADLRGQWLRQWRGAYPKGTRQLVPALVDPDNPGLTGPVQNQPDFQAGAVDHRTHFASAVPALARQAMAEYSALTGREYKPVLAYGCQDADYIMVGLGSITDDVRAALPYLRAQGLKVGVASVKLLQPFPEAELVEALAGAKAVTILERSDDTALTRLVTSALFHAAANAAAGPAPDAAAPAASPAPYPGVPALAASPALTTAIFGLGGHDVQPRDLIAAFKAMADGTAGRLIYLGSQFFDPKAGPSLAAIQDKLLAAYPETAPMALKTEPNPDLLPPGSLRIRFHSVGGYGTVATGKLLTDILSGVLGLHSKSAPKYGSEKSGAATNYYITLSPEPVLLTNAELEDVDVVVAPDHQAFVHTNPLKGLVRGGTFILQSDQGPRQTWAALPAHARRAIRDREIKFLVVDAFAVAKKHAPSVELETRMMGIAFIGAVIGHVEAVKQGAGGGVEDKVREQITKKFGRKGAAVVDGNLAVIADGISATTPVDYTDPAFEAAEAAPAPAPAGAGARGAALSAAMCPVARQAAAAPLFDPAYYEDLAARPFREGSIAEAPVLPGAGLFMPPGSGAAKDKGVFRRTAPLFAPDACTACLECALACPDAAIPNTAHQIGDLIGAAVDAIDAPAPQLAAIRAQIHPWAQRARQAMRQDPSLKDLPSAVRLAAAGLGDRAVERRLDRIVQAVADFPVARTKPFFEAAEAAEPGAGTLFSAVVDPWKCTGCLQCVDVCGPGALTSQDQDASLAELLASRFERLAALPPTSKQLIAGAAEPDGDSKRLLLDRDYYYAMVGGHGACRGCGEVTALRLLLALSHALGDTRRADHVKELEELIGQLDLIETDDPDRKGRIAAARTTLEQRLYLYEGGPSGRGPATTVIANSTGCSSVYASTMPSSPYLDPWVNSLFQDAQPLATGIWEGLVSQMAPEVRALRAARAEIAGDFTAAEARALATISWRDFTPQELDLLPAVMTVSGDGAAFDIGFGALSRVLAGGTPVKMVVLNTGSYSNTGGQASTASYTGQDADLARFGKAHAGKSEQRKELGLLASFHPRVFACATSTALYSHFLATAHAMWGYKDGAALMDVYTPCGTENGFGEDLSNARSRLAVESRMAPLFVHDPRRGASLPERFSLDGNPAVDALWATTTLQYLDESGQLALMQTPLTPAEFALGEVRFAKQFRKLAADDAARAVPIAEYAALDAAGRQGKVPFVWATDKAQRLIQVRCSQGIVALVEDRAHYWRTLQFLAGIPQGALAGAHRAELDQAVARYNEALASRETSLDQLAAAMAELATSSAAPALPAGLLGAAGGLGAGAAAPAGGPEAGAAGAAGAGDRPIWLDPADEPLCNDCGTCYQELPALFEKATIMVDGAAQVVGRMKPGALDGFEVTPDLSKRIARVKANCDAEIIR